MKKNLLKLFYILGFTILGVYILFLILPFILIPFSASIGEKISKEVENLSQFKLEIDKFRIITTPKLQAGVKFGNLKLLTKDNETILNLDNLELKMALLPLAAKKVKVDKISADKISATLSVDNNGKFLIEEYLKSSSVENTEDVSKNTETAPIIKLSNHLPDIKIKKHDIVFLNAKNGKKYEFKGENTNIEDFIFNKKVKITATGEVILDDFQAFDYNIKLQNQIMPDFDINTLLTSSNSSQTEEASQDFSSVNIIDIFELIKKYQLTSSLVFDVKTKGTLSSPDLAGKIAIDKISMLLANNKLPESKVNIELKNDKYTIDTILNTAQNEKTTLNGYLTLKKNLSADISCNSNANLKSIFDIVKTIAKIANINELETLQGSGKIDADCNIKINSNKISSNGKIKLDDGKIKYGAYDVSIDNIVSDILLNDDITINKLGFSTFSIPFNITGKIDKNSNCDIKIVTSKLPIKSLLISLGQGAILKENPINAGTISINVQISEKMSSPKIKGDVSIDNLNLKNSPSNTIVKINPLKISLNTTKTGYTGSIDGQNIELDNPSVVVSVPTIKGTIDENNIKIENTKTLIGKNEVSIEGVISDYLSQKINLDFDTKGKIISNLKGNVNPNKMTLNLAYKMNEANIIIPSFDKSELDVSGNLNITGTFEKPYLKGSFNIPKVTIPEALITVNNMTTEIDGVILNGKFTVGEFISGGIKAQNVKSDYKLSGNDFYLNNLTGSSFNGTFNGNILYNLQTAKCNVNLKGENMDALSAVEGASGIKNALTGTLKFNSNLNFVGVEYEDIINSLLGSADFEISNGTLLNIMTLDSFLGAQNIVSNSFLKSSMQKVSTLSSVKDASKFDNIKGQVSFNKGYINLEPVTMQGNSMSYYIKGKYKILTNYADIVVLGRLSDSVTGSLGTIGNFATDKLTSYIQGLGVLTSSIAKSMSTSSNDVSEELIPSINSSSSYSDFKVVITGNAQNPSSIKSFRWINDIDTSELDSKNDVTNVIQGGIESVKSSIQNNASTDEIKNTIKDTKDALKSIFKTK